MPAASMLMATPAMSWLPLSVMAATPCSRAVVERHRHAGEQAEPGRAGHGSDGAGGEGSGQHLALEADIEQAGALGIHAGQAGQQQRRRQADGGVEDGENGGEIHAQLSVLAVETRDGVGLLSRARTA